jgi:hypothetical protein
MSPFPLFRASDTRLPTLCLALILTLPGKSAMPDPVLKLGLNNLPIDGPDRYSVTRDFMTMRSVGVMQELTRADKRSARVRAPSARSKWPR